MRLVFAILFLTLASCNRDLAPEKAKAGQDECAVFKKMATHCLRDWLTGEDSGGTWQQIGTTPQNISSLLVCENPCIEWDPLACGQYNLMYIVGDACCRDTAYVNPLKCCLTGISNCN